MTQIPVCPIDRKLAYHNRGMTQIRLTQIKARKGKKTSYCPVFEEGVKPEANSRYVAIGAGCVGLFPLPTFDPDR